MFQSEHYADLQTEIFRGFGLNGCECKAGDGGCRAIRGALTPEPLFRFAAAARGADVVEGDGAGAEEDEGEGESS